MDRRSFIAFLGTGISSLMLPIGASAKEIGSSKLSSYPTFAEGDLIEVIDGVVPLETIESCAGKASIYSSSGNKFGWSVSLQSRFGSFKFTGTITVYAIDDSEGGEVYFGSYPVKGSSTAGNSAAGTIAPNLTRGFTYVAYLSGTAVGTNGSAAVAPGLKTYKSYY